MATGVFDRGRPLLSATHGHYPLCLSDQGTATTIPIQQQQTDLSPPTSSTQLPVPALHDVHTALLENSTTSCCRQRPTSQYFPLFNSSDEQPCNFAGCFAIPLPLLPGTTLSPKTHSSTSTKRPVPVLQAITTAVLEKTETPCCPSSSQHPCHSSSNAASRLQPSNFGGNVTFGTTLSPSTRHFSSTSKPVPPPPSHIPPHRPRSHPHPFFLHRWLPTSCQTTCFIAQGDMLFFLGTDILTPVTILQVTQPYTYKCSCLHLIIPIVDAEENEPVSSFLSCSPQLSPKIYATDSPTPFEPQARMMQPFLSQFSIPSLLPFAPAQWHIFLSLNEFLLYKSISSIVSLETLPPITYHAFIRPPPEPPPPSINQFHFQKRVLTAVS